MAKLTLTDLANLQNETTAVNAINANNAATIAAMNNTLSRDGTTPNPMGASLDMNGNDILNLPAPSTVNSPARLIDVVSNPTISVPATGTSGHTVPFLDGANTWSGVQTFGAAGNVGKLTIAGNTSGSTVLNSTAVASGTLTLPAATDTLVGKATTDVLTNKTLTTPVISTISNTGTLTLPTSTDTLVGKATTDILTNKTFDTAGTGNSLQVNGVAVSRGQYVGTATNDNATAGNIGEFISATGSGVALTSGVGFNTAAISLTAGDWDVWGYTGVSNTGTTTYTFFSTGITLVNSTVGGQVMSMNVNIAGATYSFVPPMQRISLSSTTTVFLAGTATFSGGSPTASGAIYARRVR